MNDVPLRRNRLRVVQSAPTPDALLAMAAKGDRSAYSDFYDLAIERVYGISRRVLRDRALAEEVAQEVMVEVWRKAPQFDTEKGSALAWCSTIAHRRAVDRVRSEQARRNREQRSFEHDSSADEIADALVLADEHDEVADAMATLTTTQQEAVRMAFYDGRTHTEVAELLDIPLGTAKTRIRDGLIKLRDAVVAEGRPT